MFRNTVINLCSNIFVIFFDDYPRLTMIRPLINRVKPRNEIQRMGNENSNIYIY